MNYLLFLVQLLLPAAVFAKSKGVVDVTLEWHTGRQTYVYVFSGVVSRQGRPSPSAKVRLVLNAPGQELVEETVASEDGTYELKVTVAGVPEETADWKLIARGTGVDAEAAEVEGRTILTVSDEAVMVQRPIQLVQG